MPSSASHREKIVNENSFPLVLKRLPRILTAPLRVLPDFIIIGAQRAGTTSLYEYLTAHPCVAAAFIKEVHFFDNNYAHGLNWYRAFFPIALVRDFLRRGGTGVPNCRLLSGEASPYYLCHPHAARRVRETLPGIKLIVLLRNPIDRAYSHYHHHVRLGIETLAFEQAIAQEEARLSGEYEKMLADEHYYSFNHQAYSYLARGRYAEQLERWFSYFPKEQILILKSEDFQQNIPRTMDAVFQFLELPPRHSSEYPTELLFRKHHEASYPPMSELLFRNAAIRTQLIKYFEHYNQKLYDLLESNFGW
jgi:hypothetical protein